MTLPLPAGTAFGDTLRRLYDRLPEFYRTADLAQAGPDFPLFRFLSLVVDQAGEVATLVDRFGYIALEDGGAEDATSDLVDPAVADAAWLAWLGQLVGVAVPAGLSGVAQRDLVAGGSSGWRAGSKQAIVDAARSVLVGSRYAAVYDHSTDVSAVGGAGEWDVLIVTRTTETPDPALVIPAVVAAGAKPAGVELWHRGFEATWAVIEAARPTWADWDGATWTDIEETGL